MCSPGLKSIIANPNIPSPMFRNESAYGYPVLELAQAERMSPGTSDYLAKNPHVAGMAMGAGMNETKPIDTRSIIINSKNESMFHPMARDSLKLIEAARHRMAETAYKPKFAITPEIQSWRESQFKESDPYLRNDDAFKASMVSRGMVGNLPSIPTMKSVQAESDSFTNQHFPQVSPSAIVRWGTPRTR